MRLLLPILLLTYFFVCPRITSSSSENCTVDGTCENSDSTKCIFYYHKFNLLIDFIALQTSQWSSTNREDKRTKFIRCFRAHTFNGSYHINIKLHVRVHIE